MLLVVLRGHNKSHMTVNEMDLMLCMIKLKGKKKCMSFNFDRNLVVAMIL